MTKAIYCLSQFQLLTANQTNFSFNLFMCRKVLLACVIKSNEFLIARLGLMQCEIVWLYERHKLFNCCKLEMIKITRFVRHETEEEKNVCCML